jgi:SPX domain protein involved in polyphosphate accumulation
MVKFGISLQTDKVAKWADGYVNYDALKDTLSEMIHTGAALARVPVRTASPRIGGWR